MAWSKSLMNRAFKGNVRICAKHAGQDSSIHMVLSLIKWYYMNEKEVMSSRRVRGWQYGIPWIDLGKMKLEVKHSIGCVVDEFCAVLGLELKDKDVQYKC